MDVYKCLRSDSPRGGAGTWIQVCVWFTGGGLRAGGKQNGKAERAKQGLVPGKSSQSLTEGGAWTVVPPWSREAGLLNFRFRQSLASWSWLWEELVRWLPSGRSTAQEKTVWGALAAKETGQGGSSAYHSRCICSTASEVDLQGQSIDALRCG